jgi:hypothetical protein
VKFFKHSTKTFEATLIEDYHEVYCDMLQDIFKDAPVSAPAWLAEITASHPRLIIPETNLPADDTFAQVRLGVLTVSEEPPYVVTRILAEAPPVPSAWERAKAEKKAREDHAKKADRIQHALLKLDDASDEELQVLYDALPGERCPKGRYKGMILSTTENEVSLRVICAEINRRFRATQTGRKMDFNTNAIAHGFRTGQRVSLLVPSLVGQSLIEGVIVMRGGVLAVKIDSRSCATRRYAALHKGWKIL